MIHFFLVKKTMFLSIIISLYEEYSPLPGEHPVQPGAGGEGHQLGEHIVRVVLREGEAAVWDKVEGEREDRVSNPHSVLTIP